MSTEASIPQKNQPYHTSNMKELIEASSFITWLMAAHLCRVILITISLQLLSNQNVLKLCFFTCQTPNSEKKKFLMNKLIKDILNMQLNHNTL